MTMIQAIAEFEGRVAKVAGCARSGKTEALVQRCAHLLKAGTSPNDVRIIVASGFAAQALRERLKAAVGTELEQAAAQVAVTTALDACVEVLDAPEARAATGRVPRLLTKSEYSFLLEDLKTSGIATRRLRNMLGFVYRQLANAAHYSTWRTGEEAVVCDQMLENLTLMGGMIAQECPMLAVDYLQQIGTDAAKRHRYLLVDDYQNLTKAEQTALCLMAGEQLIVCGNPNQTVELNGSYPNPEGFCKFDALRRNVEVFTLTHAFGNPHVQAFANALCSHGNMDAAFAATTGTDTRQASPTGDDSATYPQVKAVKWPLPENEFNDLTKYLRVKFYHTDDDARESRTCVVVPNRRWAGMLEKALTKRGFEISTAGMGGGIGGDPRELARCRSLITYTKLNLLAHPDDLVAWRCWCGYGNYLTNSDAWAGLLAYAKEHELTLSAALDEVARAPKEPFLRSNVLVERWVSGHEFIERNAKRKGYALLRALDAEDLPEFADVKRFMVGDETAEQVYALLRRQVTDPVYPADPHVLRIAQAASLTGTAYDNIVFCGFIDGFAPTRAAFEVVSTEEDRQNALDRERRVFYTAVSKAECNLLFSFFTKSHLELAEKTKMQVTRVRSENGERIALVRPSSFLTEAGPACPTTIGGQAFMAALEAGHEV